jgi:phytoene dehydrogenase-like protein
MARPRVLLLDEPSLGLAPLVLRQVFDALGKLRELGVTVLLVEQNATLTLELADRGYVLERGRIVVEGGAARGVEIETGPKWARRRARVRAGVVVSNADLLLTLERLVGAEHVGAGPLAAIKDLRPTHPCFLVHVGLRDMPTEVLREAEGYHWSSWNPDDVATDAFKIFVPTLFDPALAPPGGHIVIVQKLTDVDFDSVTDWAAHKAAVEHYVMSNLERVMPGFSEKVVVCLSASALTSYRYTLNHHGAMLGWEMAPDQLGPHRPALNGLVKNLYFVGHWTQPGGGITPVIVSAMRVAKTIAGRAGGCGAPAGAPQPRAAVSPELAGGVHAETVSRPARAAATRE